MSKISNELCILLKKYKVKGSLITDFDCEHWDLSDKKKLISAMCRYYNSNTSEFIKNIVETYNLKISITDLKEGVIFNGFINKDNET